MKDKKIPLIVIVGPTASGKTDLSIKLAKELDAEIISADSMQIYKGMDIATAKPSKEEMQGIAHHLIDFVDVDERFSVAAYIQCAKKAIDDITSRGKRVIVVGGTGLYVNSLIDNIIFDDEEENTLRKTLTDELNTYGNEYMYNKLYELDPKYAEKLHLNDTGRIIRGIEINLLYGHNMSQHKIISRSEQSPYHPLIIGINYRDRQKLYDRIDMRVDKMLEMGLVEETRAFYNKLDVNKTAVQAIGYKELFPYIRGELTLKEATDNLKKATRNYAKRQLTWFRKDPRTFWLFADELSKEELFLSAKTLCESFNL